jgi:hypothetical protein
VSVKVSPAVNRLSSRIKAPVAAVWYARAQSQAGVRLRSPLGGTGRWAPTATPTGLPDGETGKQDGLAARLDLVCYQGRVRPE